MPAECAVCHQPIRSTAAVARRVGSGCWRNLTGGERAVIRRLLKYSTALSTARVRAALNQPTPVGDGQLPLDTPEISTP
jgi:hypothetical protein